MLTITIIIEPVGPDTFTARHDGAVLVAGSREPFCAAARVLIERGVDPAARLVMRHAGADHDALRAKLGAAAKLTIEDGPSGAPRFRRWRASRVWGVSPPIRFDETEAPHLAPDAGARPRAEVAP